MYGKQIVSVYIYILSYFIPNDHKGTIITITGDWFDNHKLAFTCKHSLLMATCHWQTLALLDQQAEMLIQQTEKSSDTKERAERKWMTIGCIII